LKRELWKVWRIWSSCVLRNYPCCDLKKCIFGEMFDPLKFWENPKWEEHRRSYGLRCDRLGVTPRDVCFLDSTPKTLTTLWAVKHFMLFNYRDSTQQSNSNQSSVTIEYCLKSLSLSRPFKLRLALPTVRLPPTTMFT
jgi:hypothetical protein